MPFGRISRFGIQDDMVCDRRNGSIVIRNLLRAMFIGLLLLWFFYYVGLHDVVCLILLKLVPNWFTIDYASFAASLYRM